MRPLSKNDIVYVTELIPQDVIEQRMIIDDENSTNAYFRVIEDDILEGALLWAKSWQPVHTIPDKKCKDCGIPNHILFRGKQDKLSSKCYHCLLSRAFGEAIGGKEDVKKIN